MRSPAAKASHAESGKAGATAALARLRAVSVAGVQSVASAAVGVGVVLCVVFASAGCGSASQEPALGGQATTTTVADPYLDERTSYPYVSDLQKDATRAYLRCMRQQGVALRGPYLDYRHTGMVFKPQGAPAPLERLRAAGSHCPQNLVALFLAGAADDSDMPVFAKASKQFAQCMRNKGIADFPVGCQNSVHTARSSRFAGGTEC